MWISRKKYEELINKNEYITRARDRLRCTCDATIQTNMFLLDENERMKKRIEELKVKYADEVKKNFELASYLSEVKDD